MSQARKAFTIIELLVVIAIIAILAAIIFPVYSRAKASSYRSSDLSSMNTLRSAILLYKEDQGGFPPAILGYASLYTSGPMIGQVIPANSIKSYLYPKRVAAASTFKPSFNRVADNLTANAVYPLYDPAQGPQIDTNGDGVIDALDMDASPTGNTQHYGHSYLDASLYAAGDRVCTNGLTITDSPGCTLAVFYKASGYDIADVRGRGPYPHLRYSLFWSSQGLSTGGANDDPRQLGYSDPPDTTIITWNSFFREWDLAAPAQPKIGRSDIAILVGGSARPFDSVALHRRSWRVLP
jgi:prepilin-type N-terminal cleavage/methylation domain-containing protein